MVGNQKPVSFSYGELTFGSISDEEIARLERGDGVDAETQARIAQSVFFSYWQSRKRVSKEYVLRGLFDARRPAGNMARDCRERRRCWFMPITSLRSAQTLANQSPGGVIGSARLY